jgi:FAD/FMN-containing dehydrogenase
VQQISKSSCKFAVKSGGHARAAESSNIADGVTIILSRLKRVSVLPAEHIVQIGPGNRWHDVYVELEKVNLTVPGGRTGSVGVGGLILGGASVY